MAPQYQDGDPYTRGYQILSDSIARTCNWLLQEQLIAGSELIADSIEVCNGLHDLDLRLGEDRFGPQYLALQFLWHRQNPDQPPFDDSGPDTFLLEVDHWDDPHYLGAGSVHLADLSRIRPITMDETELIVDGLQRVSPTDTFLSTPASAELITAVLLDHLGDRWVDDWGHLLLEQYGPFNNDLETIDTYLKLKT